MGRLFIWAIGATLLLALPVGASLNPNDVVVVYNSNTAWNSGQRQSKAVADYYCTIRNIPPQNQCAIDWPDTAEVINNPLDFVNRIEMPIRSFLASRAGFDADDPSFDPTKAIVLCYGVPLAIRGNERASPVDSVLVLLFNNNPWGLEPIAGFGALDNPYYPWGESNPLNRGARPADFGGFRSSSYNSINQGPPSFSIVRMLDDSHALAGGWYGILFRGEKSGDAWTWTPVADKDKGFIVYQVNDISVLDSQHAWVCTDGGTLLQTNDGGHTWSVKHWAWVDSALNSPVISTSFYNDQDGWIVGKKGTRTSYTSILYQPYVCRYSSWDTSRWGDLPAGFVPASVAAADADHAWISGNSGIWYTNNGGVNWINQYNGATGDIWVRGNIGLAIGPNGSILRTTDATNWSVAPGSPTLLSSTADLAVYDASHVAIASDTGSFFLYDGTSWMANSPAAASASAAWAGDNVLSVDQYESTIRMGQVSPGDVTWGQPFITPTAHWKMRYLVCRLDGYSTPVDDATGIPIDVKNMIDRAARADAAGKIAFTDAKWVLDDSVSGLSRIFSDTVLSSIVGSSNIIHETDLSKYAINNQNVVGYASGGSYDNTANNFTTWWRPQNQWKDGAIGMFSMVSTDCRSIRAPLFITAAIPDQNIEPAKLKISDKRMTSLYDGHWVGLYKGLNPPTPPTSPTLLARADYINGMATIDLGSITWPQDDHNTYIEIHFPDNDQLHSQPGTGGERISYVALGTAVYNARSSGISYNCPYSQCLEAELIREGCSGVTGNVYEPFAGACPDAGVILPMYASGSTWAESAYMGHSSLAWMEIVVGDPLMAPYEVHPSVLFLPPTPSDGGSVRGLVALEAAATPGNGGVIERVEFWVKANGHVAKLIGTSYQPPYECVWDSEATSDGSRVYEDGRYIIQAIAYESGYATGTSMVSRSVILDSSGVQSASISQPQTDDSVVSALSPVEAQAGGAPLKVELWLFGAGDPILVGQAVSAPYQCSISSSTAQDGIYDLQAVAYYSDYAFTAYSPRRRIILVNNSTPAGSVSGLNSLADGEQVYLFNVPVVAGVSSSMDGAFYVEDSSRASGIRVETTDTTITAGMRVTVSGTLHKKGEGLAERCIIASKTWSSGSIATPQPLGMPNPRVGGQAPADTVGVTDGLGLYNTGLLVRVWGKVSYVGDNFVYIDDGNLLQDGNTFEGAIIVPLDGSAIPTQHPRVKGLRVCCGDLIRPGIGDLVSITGMSSTSNVENKIVPCVRARGQADILSYSYYTRCAKRQSLPSSWNGYFVDIRLHPIALGRKVRVVGAQVEKSFDGYLRTRHFDLPISNQFTHLWIPVYISANTQLSYHDAVTITGTTFMHDSDQWILADCIYLGGISYGARSPEPPELIEPLGY